VKVQHKYEWLYLYAFVQPQTGKTIWYILPELNTVAFQIVLANFASAVSASADKRILLMLDQAPWHTAKALELPEGLERVLQPAYSPELQPAERLWRLSDETLVNKPFLSLDQLQNALSEQCALLIDQPQRVKAHTLYHWWPLVL
jgi:transposase